MNLESSIIIVQGIRGSGKTNSLKGELRDTSPLFIVDIRNEYQHIPAFRNYAEFLGYAMKHLDSTRNGNEGKMQYRFAFSSMQEYIKLFFAFSSMANCTILFDESDALFSERKFVPPIINVFLGSRNNKITLYFVGKRPFLIPILVRSQADKYVIFRTEEERDTQYLENRTRIQFPKPPHTLKQGEAIVYRQGEKPELVNFPKFKEGE